MDNRINLIADYLENNKLHLGDLLPQDQPVRPTPQLISQLRLSLVTKEAPISVMVVGAQCWQYMLGCKDWQQVIDPATKQEDVLEGRLGVALGCDIVTDIYAHPEEKRFKSNEFAVAAFSLDDTVHAAVKGTT